MNKIKMVIEQEDWDSLLSAYSPRDCCSNLNFKEALRLADDLFFDDMVNNMQQYALKLILEIKNFFNEEWEKDWKNDVFLGNLCGLLCLYHEEYSNYKRAFDKLKDPPAELLLFLAGCDSAPGTPPIDRQKSEEYLKMALGKELTYQTALMMRGLARDKKDRKMEKYWNKISQDLEYKNICSKIIIPDVLELDKEVKEKIMRDSIDLEKFGTRRLAWKKEDALTMINSILRDKIGIVGGKIYLIKSDRIRYQYDKWLYKQKDGESNKEYNFNSKIKALKYIENYPVEEWEEIIFMISFTDLSVNGYIDDYP